MNAIQDMMNAIQDKQTVTNNGTRIAPLIDGVRVVPLAAHPDARCTLTQPPVDLFVKPSVFNVVQNLGQVTAGHMSFPTVHYDHANPDKYRLPLGADLIPYDLMKAGW